jgi:hypothetical protein
VHSCSVRKDRKSDGRIDMTTLIVAMQFFGGVSELAIGWRTFYVMENFTVRVFQTNIIRKLKSRMITWVRYVTWIGDNRKRTKNVYNHPHTHVWVRET